MLPTDINEKPKSHLKIFCFAIKYLDPKSEFILCCGLVYLFFLVYGYITELIFTLDGISGWFVTLVQFFFYAVFGLIENAGKSRSVPMKIYLLLAFLTLGTMVSLSLAKLPTHPVNSQLSTCIFLLRDYQIMLSSISITRPK